MAIHVTTHLNFRGNAREALEFYQTVFGGHLTVVTYEDAHRVQTPSEAKQVMWGQVLADNGFRIMAYDVPSQRPWDQGKDPLFVSVRGETADEIAAFWGKLSDGATIEEPLETSAWSPLYGRLRDRFGVAWVLDVAVEYSA